MATYRYLGNPRTKEFHSIARLKPECNISGDSKEQAKYKKFRTQQEAHDAGFDACGHRCVRKYKSKHNDTNPTHGNAGKVLEGETREE